MPEHDGAQSPWPGLEPKPDEIEFDHKVLEGIAKDLHHDLNRLLGREAGTLVDFAKLAYPMTLMIDPDHEPSKALMDTLQSGQEYFGLVYQEIIEKYATAIELIYAGAGVQKQVETHNTGLTASI